MPDRAAIRRRLLAWFDRHQRDLPWRHDRDPYRIWISEVMLQQTTVAAVVPFFDRFLRAFPTLADLAAADEQDVLRLWEGLGYYRRARHLHRAARILVENHNGQLPDDPAVWSELPGVGRYILGAVLSQAFDRRLPIVEANSQRLLCRIFGERRDPASAPVKQWLWQTASELLSRKRAGDFNQAMMELGALVCSPTAPRCDECPVAQQCEAKRLGLQDSIPLRSAPRKPIDVRTIALAIRKRGRILVAQRASTAGRWSNLWEFPSIEMKRGESLKQAVQRKLTSIGLSANVGRKFLTVLHGVTHHRITLIGLDAEWTGGRFRSPVHSHSVWARPTELANYPTSSAQRKLFRLAATRSASDAAPAIAIRD